MEQRRCPKCGKPLAKLTYVDSHEDDKSWIKAAGMAIAATVMIVAYRGHGANGFWGKTKRTRKTYRKFKSDPCGCEWTECMGSQGINIFGNEW